MIYAPSLTKTLAENRVAVARAWRQHLHQHPELQYDLDYTAAWVTERLLDMGVDALYHDFAPGSVVAVIDGALGAGPTIALRADMDALPIQERSLHSYRSKTAGKMHACGHDGHTATLLLAATELAATRAFRGRCVLLFQPAEEGGGGAKRMIDNGLFANDRFNIDEVYGLHNMPGLTLGHIATRNGYLMAASDRFDIEIMGRGAHAAEPQKAVDPIVTGAALVQEIQSMTARRIDPTHSVVVSVTTFDARSAYNVIPSTAVLRGSVRTLDERDRQLIETALAKTCETLGASVGAAITLDYRRGYDALLNTPEGWSRLAKLLPQVLPAETYDIDASPIMAAEDFSYFLKEKPGAFLFVGNGDSAPLHSDTYDFNDEALAIGARLWVNLMETCHL